MMIRMWDERHLVWVPLQALPLCLHGYLQVLSNPLLKVMSSSAHQEAWTRLSLLLLSMMLNDSFNHYQTSLFSSIIYS